MFDQRRQVVSGVQVNAGAGQFVRTRAQVDDLRAEAEQASSEGSGFGGLSYEDGIIAVILWLTETDEQSPMED